MCISQCVCRQSLCDKVGSQPQNTHTHTRTHTHTQLNTTLKQNVAELSQRWATDKDTQSKRRGCGSILLCCKQICHTLTCAWLYLFRGSSPRQIQGRGAGRRTSQYSNRS